MYELLIVDDERLIREGISVMVNWESHGIHLAGTARNGFEAIDTIKQNQPHIVITDIKMPVMNGLELVTKVTEKYPEIIFVILSGYGEFEFASRAMQQGVKHYLLKPCSEEKITAVLEDVKSELKRREEKEKIVRQYKRNLEKVMPLAKEQFIRDFIMNKSYTRDDLEYYSKLLNMTGERVRMILFRPEGKFAPGDLSTLTSILHELLEEKQVCFDTIVKNQVIALIKACDDNRIVEIVNRVKVGFCYYNDMDISVTYSGEGGIEDIPALYMEVQECIHYVDYLGKGSIISKGDIVHTGTESGNVEMPFDYETISMAIKSGNLQLLNAGLERFFKTLDSMGYDFNREKTYCMELFVTVIRQCQTEDMEKHIGYVLDLEKMEELKRIKEFIFSIALSLSKANHETILSKHSKLVRMIMKEVQDNLSNSNMSLKWLARKVLFMNEGYLSKLFIKETGEKFSTYLLRQRMEKAKALIEKGESNKIYEIAQEIGLGNNPRYFSQIFKKYTGFSPTEYQKNTFF